MIHIEVIMARERDIIGIIRTVEEPRSGSPIVSAPLEIAMKIAADAILSVRAFYNRRARQEARYFGVGPWRLFPPRDRRS